MAQSAFENYFSGLAGVDFVLDTIIATGLERYCDILKPSLSKGGVIAPVPGRAATVSSHST